MFKKWINRYFGGRGNSGASFLRYGGQTTAGPLITEDTALTIPAFFHAMRLYGQTLGSLDWDLIELHDKGRTIARTHSVHRLIHDEPNEFQLPASFRETIIGHAIAWGNGYAYIERNGNFRPTALLPLMPHCTRPIRTDGELQYETYVNGMKHTLEPYEVFHVPGFGGNGLTGYPLVRLMAETLGLTKAEEQFAAAYFGNGANFGGIVTMPGKLDDAAIKNLKESMQTSNGGLANAFRWMFLEEGMVATRSDANADKAQLIEARSFQLGDLARITGLAPHLLFDLSRSTNNNIEHQGIEAVTYSWKPWANKLMQEANRKLLYESEKGVYTTVIDLKPLMAGDAKTQAEKDQIRFNTASITPNEIRAKDGLNPIEGGDQLFINTATLPLAIVIEKAKAELAAVGSSVPETAVGIDTDTDTNAEPPADPTSGNSEPDGQPGPDVAPVLVEDTFRTALKPVVIDVVGRIMRRECKAVANAVQKHGADAAAIDRWLDGYAAETRQHVADAVQPVSQTIAAVTGHEIDIEAVAAAFIERTRADLTTLGQSQDRSADVALMVEGWRTERADTLVTVILEGKPHE